MSQLKLLIFLSSVRQGRNSDRVCKLVSNLATEKGFIVDVLDPFKENLPLLKTPLHYYQNQSEVPQQLHEINQRIVSADAYLFVTGEYNLGVPPALSNMIDHFPPTSFSFRPAGIVSYSAGDGGRISISHLLDTLVYLGCLVQPFTVSIKRVENCVNTEGRPSEDYVEENLKILFDQIQFTGSALKHQKQFGLLKQPILNNMF